MYDINFEIILDEVVKEQAGSMLHFREKFATVTQPASKHCKELAENRWTLTNKRGNDSEQRPKLLEK